LVNVKSDQEEYCLQVQKNLQSAGVRVEVDTSRESLSYKIRNAQNRKIPYMVIIGDKEVTSGTLQPRFWDGKNLDPMAPEVFAEFIKQESGAFWGIDTNQNLETELTPIHWTLC
jgi:threonyl-tRNA synthetase